MALTSRQPSDLQEDHFSDASEGNNDVTRYNPPQMNQNNVREENSDVARYNPPQMNNNNIDDVVSEDDQPQINEKNSFPVQDPHYWQLHTKDMILCVSLVILASLLVFTNRNGDLQTYQDMWNEEIGGIQEELISQRAEQSKLKQKLQAEQQLTAKKNAELKYVAEKSRLLTAEKSEIERQLQQTSKKLSTVQGECVALKTEFEKMSKDYDRERRNWNEYIERTNRQHQEQTKKNKPDESVGAMVMFFVLFGLVVVGAIGGISFIASLVRST